MKSKIRSAYEVISFLVDFQLNLSFLKRFEIIKRLIKISVAVDSPHAQHEILPFIRDILKLPKNVKGCGVEAGCYKGGSTAKLSIACKIAKRKLYIFDSFKGLLKHKEHVQKGVPKNILHLTLTRHFYFPPGSYRASLAEVKRNVRKFGEIDTCVFKKGWFKDTLPRFNKKIAAIYLDVDLASSTRTCLKYLYPLLVSGGVLYSHDGDIPLVLEVFRDDKFWQSEVGYPKPDVWGLGKKKLIKIVKSSSYRI